MPNYLTPGVYVEETSSGIKPLQGAGTATAAFVGFTEKGPFNEAVLVTSWTQYTTLFGDFVPGVYLPQAVYGYFLNGGGNCYVVSLGSGITTADKA
ncbi:phage tail sheath family protein, partial [Streptomyces sp. MBT57]|nr:phage tail sheath family protein [Streptomyces sp. MBT57]